jgi:arylsulfatase A-like enzyme
MNRRLFLGTSAAFSTAVFAENRPVKRPPNIVMILSDDQGWGDLSVHGNLNLNTPNIDSLARDGALFDRFYVCSVCAPTRAAMLTGRYHMRSGVFGTSTGSERMNTDEVTVADVLKADGYATGAFGKWHNGLQYPYHPNGRGFDEFYGFCCGHWNNYFDTPLEHNGEAVRSNGFITDDLTDKAMAFMTKNRNRPFLCYVPYNTPHSPFQVPDKFYDPAVARGLKMFNRDKAKETQDKTVAVMAMCENIDWNVGRILQRVDELGLREDTIVIYFADNGPNSVRWNDGMKGKKGATDEGGVRVPFLIRWPGHIKPGLKIGQLAAHIDLLPTLADFAGASTARCKPLDGVSLRPLLEGTAKDWPDRMIFNLQTSPLRGKSRTMVRTQRYRASATELYDMLEDPGQYRNIAAEKPELQGKLAEAIKKFDREMTAGIVEDRPYPVGYRESPLTVLPAQDSLFTGEGLKFSAKAPNNCWLTGWTDQTAYPYWNIDVHTAGRYQASLLYCCAAEAVGTRFELECGERKLAGQITEAFDPPLIPSPDRVKRESETYDKPFKELPFGVIELPAGIGKLKLKALSKPGKQVMEMRAIQLRLI